MKKWEFALFASLFLVFSSALGFVHVEFRQPEAIADQQIVGAGSTYWTVLQSIGGNSTDTECVHDAEDSSDCAIFPAGNSDDAASRATLINSNGPGQCCWSMDSSLQLTGQMLTDAAAVTGVSSPGQAACPMVMRSGMPIDRADESPNRVSLISGNAAGQRLGLCATLSGKVSGDNLYMPCDADGDCSTTCTIPPTAEQINRAGVYLLCKGASTSSISFMVKKQWVRK